MSRQYTVTQGDTYESISRRVYGQERYAGNIREANPGATDSPRVGSVLVIPAVPELQLDEGRRRNAQTTQDPDEVTLSINGQVFRFWTSATITQHLDAVSTVSLSAPFDPTDDQTRDAFRPYSYQDVQVDVGGERLFSGTLVNPQPYTGPGERTVRAQCYSLPGVLSDCTPPASAFPLQWDEATLRTIAADLCRPFGLQVTAPDGTGQTFERISVEPAEKVMSAIARLSAQRNLLVRSDERGRLVFVRPALAGPVVAELVEGQQPAIDIVPSFGSQDFYSHVTGITPTVVGLEGPQATVRNPHLLGTLRPFVYTAQDMAEADLRQAVVSKAGRMYAVAATYSVSVPTWRNADGDLWAVGDFVGLDAPGAMVYGRYVMQIRTVRFKATPSERTAVLELIIPGSLSGQIPEVLPWAGSPN